MTTRPQSRGGGLGPPGPPGRPGTQMGQMGQTGRPGTQMGTAAGRPGTQMGQTGRMPTGMRTRQGTALQGPGVGALTEVNVSDRPMTMQGLSGMKTGSMGPKRQIYDKTFYIVELKKRCQELTDEVASLNKEITGIQQENTLYTNLEKRYESLVKIVREMEGELADHNLATDKQRTGTQPEEVQHMLMIMKSQNDSFRNEVDSIFLERSSHQEEIASMEGEIQSITRMAEDRLSELMPDQRQEYQDLQRESARLSTELQEAREELDMVSGRLANVEEALSSDPLRLHHQRLTAARTELDTHLTEVRKEAREGSLSVPEQRELLLGRVKSDNLEITSTEKSNSDMKMEIERLKAQLREVQADASNDKKEEGSEQQKYEILFSKDKEMTSFIDSFHDVKAEEEGKLKEKQESIKRILLNISKAAELQREDVTPESHLHEMEDELEFKSKQLQNAETTQNRLVGELSKREAELEKIESLDVKISQELEGIEEKMRQYQQEIADKFDNVDQMREQGTQRLKKATDSSQFLSARSSSMRQEVSFVKLRLDSKLQQLQEDEVAAKIEAQEQKIRQFGQTLHALTSFITQRTSETDFTSEMGTCLTIASELNTMLK
eukprot:TRINITY_DN41553_c0_g1_i1.p1 TRINITY_DN41553_c0_g1~~TRINITY_DN41553_c0_g1_i1.p1  ORF type:complete len:618 (-),score=159.95 TRINITY_DN41553_c0_g1_i1:82-1908(-)